MSIPDKAVEAGGRIIAEHQSAYEHLDETNRTLLAKGWEPAARAVLEAAEPYLTGGEGEVSSQEPEWVNGDIVGWRARKESTESIVYVMIQGYWVDTNTGYRYPVGSLGISWSDGRLKILHKQEVKS